MSLTSLEALVLAGGRGSRLRAVVGDCPKAITPVAGRAFLTYVFAELRRAGVRCAILCTGFGADAVEELIGDGGRFGVQVSYSREPRPLGTGGALRNALARSGQGPLVVLNADSLVEGGLRALIDSHGHDPQLVSMLVARVPDRGRFGAVTMDREGRVVAFESAGGGGPGWVNAGAYVVERKVLEAIPEGRHVSFEDEVLPDLLPAVRAVPARAGLVDIGTPESLKAAQAIFAADRWQSAIVTAAAQHREWARRELLESASTKRTIAEACVGDILAAAELVAACLSAGGKVMLCGNGGSAADSQHLAAELINRLSADHERGPLSALALTVDSSVLTSHANDYGYATVFQRQVEGLGRPGDVLVLLSTGGNSENVLRASRAARERGIRTIGLTGGSGGKLLELVDVAVVVPSQDVQRIQEGHIAIGHVLVGAVERLLFAEGGGSGAGGQVAGTEADRQRLLER